MSQAFTLLNPGPVNVTPRVREALASCVDQCHREPEYLALQARVRERLLAVFGIRDAYDAVLLTGSGTAAMEAMVASVVRRGVLVLENGIYGDRLARMAEAHRIPCRRLAVGWHERHGIEAVSAALDDDGLDTIALVHHETTTGLVNDVEAVGRLARETGRRLIVDSVSGLGGEPFDFASVRPDAVCSTANKCIQGLPGVSFVLLARGTELTSRSVYLDLASLRDVQARGDTPFTPAIQVTAALEAALDELAEETVEGRIERYGRAAARIRRALEALGLALVLPKDLRSHTITSARLPAGRSYEQIHDAMRDDGFVIYAGPGELARTAFRVANMGVLPDEALTRFEAAIARAVR